MEMQSTGNQQIFDSPDKSSVADAKKLQRDVAPNQVAQDRLSELVTFELLEPAVSQELTLEAGNAIRTGAVLVFAKPKFVLAQWKHCRIEEGQSLGKTLPKRASS